jgi:hypothetical protein
VFVTRYLSEKYASDYLSPTFKKYNSVIGWGSIGYRFKGRLVFWDSTKWRKITGKGYLEHILLQV